MDKEESEKNDDKPRAKAAELSYASRKPGSKVKAGFFTIFKHGQGYWTRMGTAGAAAFLLALTIVNLYAILSGTYHMKRDQAMVASSVVCLALVAWAWKLMNTPRSVDFMIATDSEMKKVNWTSRKDLIGATKVVIFFMFLIALILLVIDVVFGYFFQLINVLKTGPFG